MGAPNDSGREDVELGTLATGTRVLAASVENGVELLTTPDEFVHSQSTFDRQARLNLSSDVVEVSLEMYLDYVGSQVQPWSQPELAALKTSIVPSISSLLTPYSVRLPDVLYLVKTSGQEEGGAAYTRHRNVVVLPANMVVTLFAPPSGDPLHEGGQTTYLTNILLHECFHIISKNNLDLRRDLYKIVHYELLAKPVELPDVPWPEPTSSTLLPQVKLTNPDAPILDVYIDLHVAASATDEATMSGTGHEKHLMPLLLASSPYRGGVFFDYLEWLFLAIAPGPDGRWVAELDNAGRPVVYPSTPLLGQYEEKIGRNLTDELFHPDEILAQNWVFVANQPSLQLLVDMARTMKRE
jgi:hypothetical protein